MATHGKDELREAARVLGRAALQAGFRPGAGEPAVGDARAAARALGTPARTRPADARRLRHRHGHRRRQDGRRRAASPPRCGRAGCASPRSSRSSPGSTSPSPAGPPITSCSRAAAGVDAGARHERSRSGRPSRRTWRPSSRAARSTRRRSSRPRARRSATARRRGRRGRRRAARAAGARAEPYLIRDLARDLGLPLVVAARPGLGTINHTLLTLEAARAAGLDVLGVVLTPWPAEPSAIERSNRATIERLGGVHVDVARRTLGLDASAELAAAGRSALRAADRRARARYARQLGEPGREPRRREDPATS